MTRRVQVTLAKPVRAAKAKRRRPRPPVERVGEGGEQGRGAVLRVEVRGQRFERARERRQEAALERGLAARGQGGRVEQRLDTQQGLGDRVKVIHGNGADHDAAPESLDLTMCIGASWVWNGHAGTLKALMEWTKPGGLVLVGEPYKLQEPTPEHIEADEFVGSLVTHGCRLGSVILESAPREVEPQ